MLLAHLPRIERLDLATVELPADHPAVDLGRSADVHGFLIDHPGGDRAGRRRRRRQQPPAVRLLRAEPGPVRRRDELASEVASRANVDPVPQLQAAAGEGEQRDAVRMLVIDAANLIGSRPTGWWRDRPGAARGFTQRVRATVAAGRLDPPLIIVLEGQSRAGADEAVVDGVEVVHASGEGDDTIAALADAHPDVVVVTADRELAARVRASNAEVVRPSWLLDQLVE